MDDSPVLRHQLDALADPTRRAILELLRDQPLPAGAIAARFDQQRPAISKHLTFLRETGWLRETRHRQQRIYSLRQDAVVVLLDWARQLRPGDGPSPGLAGSPHISFIREEPEDETPSLPAPRSDFGLDFD